MIGIGLLLLGGCLAVASAQQQAIVVEDIVNDVIKPNDGPFSNVVEQFGIVSFSPTPSATASGTPSASPSASISSTASVFASSSPSTSSSALPSPVSPPTPSFSTSPSSSVSPSPQGRRPSTPSAPSPSASSATSSSTPSPSPDPCADITVTLPASGYESLGFVFLDDEGESTIDVDAAIRFADFELGYNCDTIDPSEYLNRLGTGFEETVAVAVKKASDDGFLDSPKNIELRAHYYVSRNADELQAAGVREIVSIAAYTFSGSADDLASGGATSVEELPILPCCRAIEPMGSACATDVVATLQIVKNTDGSLSLTSSQTNPQTC